MVERSPALRENIRNLVGGASVELPQSTSVTPRRESFVSSPIIEPVTPTTPAQELDAYREFMEEHGDVVRESPALETSAPSYDFELALTIESPAPSVGFASTSITERVVDPLEPDHSAHFYTDKTLGLRRMGSFSTDFQVKQNLGSEVVYREVRDNSGIPF